MQHRTRTELYRDFIQFVQRDTQRERTVFKRRMVNVLIWCLALPAFFSMVYTVGVKAGLIATRYQKYSDWIMLAFPVVYSLYFLRSHMAAEAGAEWRKAGIAGNLGQTLRQAEWRDRTCTELQRVVPAREGDWPWISQSFRMDIEEFQNRTKFITALAGAVFFLIFQGLDLLSSDGGHRTEYTPSMVISWVEVASSQMIELAALVLFLVLLYLSGMETVHSLERYLNCSELLRLKAEEEKRASRS